MWEAGGQGGEEEEQKQEEEEEQEEVSAAVRGAGGRWLWVHLGGPGAGGTGPAAQTGPIMTLIYKLLNPDFSRDSARLFPAVGAPSGAPRQPRGSETFFDLVVIMNYDHRGPGGVISPGLVRQSIPRVHWYL